MLKVRNHLIKDWISLTVFLSLSSLPSPLQILFVLVVQLLSCLQLFVTLWPVACQNPLSTISWSLVKFMSIEWVMLSNHLILCCPLLLLCSIFPGIRAFSNESAFPIRWPKYLELQQQSFQ